MRFKMTKKLNGIFDTCSEKSLDPETTALVTFAAQLANGQESIDVATLSRSVKDSKKLHRAACLAACTSGQVVGERFERALTAGKIKGAKGARKFTACTEETLDKKTHHLVSLAACLASNCECASGHIVQARNAGASDEELARTACLTACVAGERSKYSFLAHLEETRECRSCVC